jgi:hypothetical protein
LSEDNKVNEAENYYLVFLTQLFREVLFELELLSNSFRNHTALAQSWRGHLEGGTVRSRLYDNVVDGARRNLEQLRSEGVVATVRVSKAVRI